MRTRTNISPKVEAALEFLQGEPSANLALAGASIAAAEGAILREDAQQYAERARYEDKAGLAPDSAKDLALAYRERKDEILASLRDDLAGAGVSKAGIEHIAGSVENIGFRKYGDVPEPTSTARVR